MKITWLRPCVSFEINSMNISDHYEDCRATPLKTRELFCYGDNKATPFIHLRYSYYCTIK